MNKKKIMLSVAAVLASCTLAACGKVDGGINDPVIPQNTKEDSKTETIQSTTNQTTEKENSNNSDDVTYKWPASPWILHYPKDVAHKDEGSLLVTKDVTKYLVTAGLNVPYDGELEWPLEENVANMVITSICAFDDLCPAPLGYRYEKVDDRYVPTGINEIEGEYVDINGLNVYKFTAKAPTKNGDWDCYVYGYTWNYLTPDVKDEKFGFHKYSDAGETVQYAIVGVVMAYDQDAYKADMEELTDYLMNSTQMLSD